MEVRNLSRLWRVISIAAVVMLFSATAWAAYSVQVVSQTGLTGGTRAEVRIKVSNDDALLSLVAPFVLRQVGTGGPTIDSLAMRYRERLGTQIGVDPLSGLILTNRFNSETGTCKAGAAGGFKAPPQDTDSLMHVVSVMPQCALFVRNSVFPSTPLPPGADATGSLMLILHLAAGDGCVIIDTTCADPANHLLMARQVGGAVPNLPFSPGVVCVGECSVDAVDQETMLPVADDIDSDTVTFSWGAVPGATSYTIQIGFDANLSNVLQEATVSTPHYNYVIPPGDVYWRVRANLAGACSSDWTNSFRYTDVKNVTGDVVPESYKLSQNYPNPFNAGTVIDFSLQSSGHVTLEVFNILGQSVVTLLDADKSAGLYSVEWTGEDSRGHSVPSGMYFYRLSTDRFKEVKKMTLLK